MKNRKQEMEKTTPTAGADKKEKAEPGAATEKTKIEKKRIREIGGREGPQIT